VFPAHGAGSACGKNLSTERQSTIGAQRRTNYACRPMSESDFLRIVTADQPPPPEYFGYDALLNRREHELYDPTARPVALSAAEFMRRRAAGAIVVDARNAEDFAAGHLSGSINVPADGRFAETAGSVLRPNAEILVIAPAGREEELVMRLARIGFDQLVGYLDGAESVFHELAADVVPASRLTAAALRAALDGPRPPQVLDVRKPGERADGKIEGSGHIPLAELTGRIEEIPRDRPLVVHCAGGYRSSVAASLLRRAGHTDVSDLLGGFAAWSSAEPAGAVESASASAS
jgi:hydroxyacylglutathione hydrolase